MTTTNALQTDERHWEILCHLSPLLFLTGIPLANIVGPLAVWLYKRDQSGSVDLHGKESINFQISLTLYLLVLGAVTAGLMFVLIGFLLVPALIMALIAFPIIELVFILVGTLRARDGQIYRYPLTIRFIR